jgi:hypothetical protein
MLVRACRIAPFMNLLKCARRRDPNVHGYRHDESLFSAAPQAFHHIGVGSLGGVMGNDPIAFSFFPTHLSLPLLITVH